MLDPFICLFVHHLTHNPPASSSAIGGCRFTFFLPSFFFVLFFLACSFTQSLTVILLA